MDYKDKYLKYKYKYLYLKKIENYECLKKVQKGGGGSDGYCYLCGAPIDTDGSFTVVIFVSLNFEIFLLFFVWSFKREDGEGVLLLRHKEILFVIFDIIYRLMIKIKASLAQS